MGVSICLGNHSVYINQGASNIDDVLRWNRPLTIATVYDHNMLNNNILQVITKLYDIQYYIIIYIALRV